jgi:hypothetical protein
MRSSLDLVGTDVSDKIIASIIKFQTISELGITDDGGVFSSNTKSFQYPYAIASRLQSSCAAVSSVEWEPAAMQVQEWVLSNVNCCKLGLSRPALVKMNNGSFNIVLTGDII